MRKRDGWMVAMVAIVAVGTTAAQRNDGNGTIWRVSYRESGSVKP